MIIDGRLVDDVTAKQVAMLFDRARRKRAAADAEETNAKQLLQAMGMPAIVVLTEKAARLRLGAQLDESAAVELLDACPAQVVTDATWTG
jgi:hypothetical protein